MTLAMEMLRVTLGWLVTNVWEFLKIMRRMTNSMKMKRKMMMKKKKL